MRGLRRLARCCAALVLVWSTGGSVAANTAIEHWTSEHGAAVYFVAAPEIPMLDVRLVFAAGSARDGGQPGVAALTNDLFTEGTATLAPDEFHSRLDATGAILGSARFQLIGALITGVFGSYAIREAYENVQDPFLSY